MTFDRGEHVVVTQFIRTGDDADTDTLDGWVVHHSDTVIVIADAPDWATLDPALYLTRTFSLDRVIVSPYTAPLPADAGHGEVLVILIAAAAAVITLSILGRAWPLLIGAVAGAALITVFALTWGTRKDQP